MGRREGKVSEGAAHPTTHALERREHNQHQQKTTMTGYNQYNHFQKE
jgi:hypothetical protein